MRIGVDGLNLAMPRGTGIATYARELVAALRVDGHEIDGIFGLAVPPDPTLRETAFFDAFQHPPVMTDQVRRRRRRWRYLRPWRTVRPRAVALTGQVEKRAFAARLPAFDRILTSAYLFEDALASFRSTGRFITIELPGSVDVMHWTYPVPILARGIPNIYTIHDLVPLKLPYTTLDNKTLYGRMIAHCIDKAATICTVSEASARDIVAYFGIDRARVVNTYQTVTAPDEIVSGDPRRDAEAVEGVFGLTLRGYFLYYGAIEPKKNVGRLIEAYLSLRSEAPLIIVGARAWRSEDELRLMPGGGASGAAGTFHGQRGQTIVRLEYLPRPILTKLVRGAKAVVFPSLYEGFGLPVLEAMMLGTPVIASTTGSLPEIVGDAALLVDPYDVDALTAAMRRIDGDAALAREMSARGPEQAARFSQLSYRERLTQLYRAAMTAR